MRSDPKLKGACGLVKIEMESESTLFSKVTTRTLGLTPANVWAIKMISHATRQPRNTVTSKFIPGCDVVLQHAPLMSRVLAQFQSSARAD